ncbi:MAG: AlpA family transcriptional regulator [Methylococcaceae bacterium]
MTTSNIIRLPRTIQKTGLSRSTIYTLISRGEFPTRIKLSIRVMGFYEADIDAWIAERAAASKVEV